MNSQQQYIYNLLRQHFNHNASLGIMGNIHVETGGRYDYTIPQDNGGNGYGLFQFDFHKPYYFNYLQQHGMNDSAQSQIAYVVSTIYGENKYILGEGNANHLRQLLEDQSQSVRDLTIHFCNLWQKPAQPNLGNRIKAAEQLSHCF